MSKRIKDLIVEDGLDRQEKTLIVKIILLGAGGVGKTSIRHSFLGQSFKENYLMTIGADFAIKTAQISHNGIDYTIKYQIWDLAGQPLFSNVRTAYFNGALGGVLVFDLTRPETLDMLWRDWLVALWNHSGHGTIPVVLLGNKEDVDHPIKYYLTKKAQKIAKRLTEESTKSKRFSIEFFQTSAKTGLNVNNAFQKLSTAILNYMEYVKHR